MSRSTVASVTTRGNPVFHRRWLVALFVSVSLHGAFLTMWHRGAVTPPAVLSAAPMDIELVSSTPARAIRHAAPTASPARRASPAPADEPAAPSPATATAAIAPADAQAPLVGARSDVASLNNPKPPYPLAARRSGVEGTVVLSVHVSTDGAPAEVRLKQTSGHALLDNTALDTVRRWHFVPAQRGPVPVDSWVDIPVRFRLTG